MSCPNRHCCTPCDDMSTKHRRGGIEPLHVSMPHGLKPCPSTSPTHPGRMQFVKFQSLLIHEMCQAWQNTIATRIRPRRTNNAAHYLMVRRYLYLFAATYGGTRLDTHRTTWTHKSCFTNVLGCSSANASTAVQLGTYRYTAQISNSNVSDDNAKLSMWKTDLTRSRTWVVAATTRRPNH